MARIRLGEDQDVGQLCEVHREAFGEEQGPEIVDLVRALLADATARPVLSLVAEAEGRIVGHVLFSAVRIEGAPPRLQARILAPLAVSPGHQGAGTGAALIREGLGRLRQRGVGVVFVLGDPEYYRRFGFEPAGKLGLVAPYPIPAEHQDAWMVQALEPGVLEGVRGRVGCAEALDSPQHW